MKAALLVASSLLAACGSSSPDTARFAVQMDAVAVSEVGLFQIALVKNAKLFSCQADCLADQIRDDQIAGFDLVPHEVGDGERPVLTIGATVSASGDGSSGTQVVELEIPVGKNYAIIVEAISRDQRFLGSSCGFIDEVTRAGADVSVNRLYLDADPAICSAPDARVSP